MNYSLEKISTVEACDALLRSAHKEKENLERKKRNLGEAITRLHDRTSKLSIEQASVQVLLEAFTTAYGAVPGHSRQKVNFNLKIKRLEVRKARLDIAHKVHSLLKKQVDYNVLDRLVSVVDAYIGSVQHRKMALRNAASNTVAISANDSALAFAATFSAPSVVPVKQRSAKKVYNYRVLFSSQHRRLPIRKPVGTIFTQPDNSLFRVTRDRCSPGLGTKVHARPTLKNPRNETLRFDPRVCNRQNFCPGQNAVTQQRVGARITSSTPPTRLASRLQTSYATHDWFPSIR